MQASLVMSRDSASEHVVVCLQAVGRNEQEEIEKPGISSLRSHVHGQTPILYSTVREDSTLNIEPLAQYDFFLCRRINYSAGVFCG